MFNSYKIIFNILMLASLVILLFGCGGGSNDSSTDDTVAIDVASYANFNSRWEYQNNEPDYPTPIIEVLGTDILNGKETYVLQEYDPAPNDRHYYSPDMTIALYFVGGINDFQETTESEFFWEPGIPYLMANFIPGEQYSFQSISPDDGDVVTGTISTVKEAVTVPAGTYTDCYKVTLSGSVNGGEIENNFIWWAKDVGMVKRIGFGGGAWELVNYIP